MEEKKISTFESVLSFFLGLFGDKKKRALKPLNKKMIKSGYRYYGFVKDLITPEFANFLFTVYEAVAPFRDFFLSNPDESKYVDAVMVRFLTEDQIIFRENFSDESIETGSESSLFEEVRAEAMEGLSRFKKTLTVDQSNDINALYNGVMAFRQFCLIDYYSLLKFFMPLLKENSFQERTNFTSVERKNVALKILDFITATESLLMQKNLSDIFEFVKSISLDKKLEVTSLNAMTMHLKVQKDKDILSCFACIVQQDSEFVSKGVLFNKDIVASYIEETTNHVNVLLTELFLKKRDEEIKILVGKVFGNKKMHLLRNYTDEKSFLYEQAGFKPLYKCNPLSFLNAFNEACVKTSLLEFVDVFCVRAVAQDAKFILKVSNAMRGLITNASSLAKLDMQLEEKFQVGYNVKNLFANVEDDPHAAEQLEEIISKLNEEAEKIYTDSIDKLYYLEKALNLLLSDKITGDNQIVENWDSVDSFFKDSVESTLEHLLSLLKNFLSLMDCYN